MKNGSLKGQEMVDVVLFLIIVTSAGVTASFAGYLYRVVTGFK